MPFKITNRRNEAVNAMYAGTPYAIPAGGSIEVEDRTAAEKLAADLAPHVILKEIETDGTKAEIAHAQDAKSAKGKAKGKE